MMKIRFNITLIQIVLIVLIGITLILLEKESEAMDTNRLIDEKSPYLLQHAHNPVQWYPWGEEAFTRAREEDKPIFLSIGYSTCHWCHVMERESFENAEIARLLNENFIAIKVDREERPDIDHIYMNAVQLMTGSGGWPLSVFITADGKPFYGGTYFPPESRFGMPGFADLLQAIMQAWQNERANLITSSTTILEALQNLSISDKDVIKKLSPEDIQKTYLELRDQFDSEHGGFGTAQKFPMGHSLSFLVRYSDAQKDKVSLALATKTLNAIAAGGIYDHIGGGIHRYASDPAWRIPHFEKMLYDQALIVRAYLEAYQVTRDERYAAVAREIFDYVLRDLRDRRGGFYSAEDADSLVQGAAGPEAEGEGAFYVWRYDEVADVLNKKERKLFTYLYGVEKNGNVEADPQGEFVGENILYQARTLDETADKFNCTREELNIQLANIKNALFKVRAKRPRPHCDDKVLTDWNGLMIASLAYGSRVLADDRYREAAEQCAQFILSEVMLPDGMVFHRWRENEAAIDGFIDDHASLLWGLLELYEATFKATYLDHALKIARVMIARFWDDENGGFFLSSRQGELIVRGKDFRDGALPSGNSVAAYSFIRLARLTGNSEWARYAERIFSVCAHDVALAPSAYTHLIAAYQYYAAEPTEIVIAEGEARDRGREFVEYLDQTFLPNAVRILRPADNDEYEAVKQIIPGAEQYPAQNGKTTVYVCKNFACLPAVTSVQALKETLYPPCEEVTE
ncbi:MAG: thioredoxin domain-containing protein [Candidatus Omnitrophica bacterium]|nr:thioredoxin domain-containing protein [Candidatus Omnitrophota bacterium]